MIRKLKEVYKKVRHADAARTLLPPLSVFLFAIYPAVFLFTRNAALVLFSSFARLIPVYILLVAVIYGISLVTNHFRTVRAANAAMAFLLFFNTYGIAYGLLLEYDLVRAEHFTLLPLFIFLGLYSSWLVSRINKETSFTLWRIITLTFVVLTAISVIRIIPHEVAKAEIRKDNQNPISINIQEATKVHPDIYYLVFDEFPGIQSLREYWHNDKVDPFVAFLEDKGFFVAQESRSSDIFSIHQIATRLNYFDYEYIKGQEETWLYSIAHNKAMAFTKSIGYNTIMIESFSRFFPTMPQVEADHIYNMDTMRTGLEFILNDEFTILVMEETMLLNLAHQKVFLDKVLEPHRKIISYAIEWVPNLEDIPAPRFLYLHLTMPHTPYLFDSEGNPVDPSLFFNWIAYEDYCEYTMTVIEDMVTAILADADPQNPPIIILQSDHGARVKPNNKVLLDFPQEFQRDILFAMYLPGYDTSQLDQDINPINTLPIIFNHYFGANIPLQ